MINIIFIFYYYYTVMMYNYNLIYISSFNTHLASYCTYLHLWQ